MYRSASLYLINESALYDIFYISVNSSAGGVSHDIDAPFETI